MKAEYDSSEADHTELLTLPGLVNYFQDCSTFQSEDIGYGRGITEKKRAGMDSFCMADCSKPLSEAWGTYPGGRPGRRILPGFSDSVI